MSVIIYRDGIEEIADSPPVVETTREGHVVEKYRVGGKEKFFVTIVGTFWCAHGSTLAEAVADAKWKDPAERPSREALVSTIQAAGSGYMLTLNEFRHLTGACADGCRIAMARAGVAVDALTARDIRDRISHEWGEKLIDILGMEFA
jgi:hypothetical protein